MPRKTIDFNTVRELGLALPGAEDGTAYGSPALKVGGQMFACIPTNKLVEPRSLAVRLSFDERDALLAEEPAVYYLKPHYVNYPCVLVRFDTIRRDALKDLLLMAHRFVSTSASKRPAPRRKRSAARSK